MSDSSIAVSKEKTDEDRIIRQRDYDLKKEALELDKVKYILNGDEYDRNKYRAAMKKKRLLKLLKEEDE